MCIIASKAPGVTVPSDATMGRAADGNPDGCGLAVRRSGSNSVLIRKGFSVAEFPAAVRQYVRTEDAAVLHWRYATHGDRNAAMCHPFPIAERADKLRATTYNGPAAVAHNGVFSGLPSSAEGLSDTAVFCRMLARSGLAHKARRPGGAVWRDILEPMIDGSRVAVLWRDGTIHRYGRGWERDGAGVFWSNGGYRERYALPSFGRDYWRDTAPATWARYYDEDADDIGFRREETACPYCGEAVSDDWVWCPICGAQLDREDGTRPL